MKSTVTIRGQTVIPAIIRKHYNILPRSYIEWIDDGNGIAIVPVVEDAITALRGKYKRYMLNEALTKSRMEERKLFVECFQALPGLGSEGKKAVFRWIGKT